MSTNEHTVAPRGVSRRRGQGPDVPKIAAAARLSYPGVSTDAEIAAELGISRRTLTRWKTRPLFAALRAALLEAWEAGYAAGLQDARPSRPGESLSDPR